jgi:hypothetical protein
LLKERDGVVPAGEGVHLCADRPDVVSIRWLSQDIRDGVTEGGWTSLFRLDRRGRAKVGESLGVAMLVGTYRHGDHRQSGIQAGQDRVESGVRDNQIAVGQQQIVGDVAFDDDMLGLGTELAWITIVPDGQDKVEWFSTETFQDRLVYVSGVVEDGAEAGVDGGKILRQPADPLRQYLVARGVERLRPDEVGGWRDDLIRRDPRGWDRRENEIASE